MAVNILAVAQTEKVDLIANAILLHQLSQPGFRTSFSDKVDLYVFYPAFFQKGYGFYKDILSFLLHIQPDTCTIRMFFPTNDARRVRFSILSIGIPLGMVIAIRPVLC